MRRSVLYGLWNAIFLLIGMVGAEPCLAADFPVPPAKIHLSFGVSAGINTAAQPVLYAKAAGIFEKHGLDVELVNMHDDTTAIQGLIAGAYDLLYCGASPGLIAAARGADVKIIDSFTPWSDFLFVAQKNIDSLKGMEGQTLGVSKIGSLSYLAAVFALKDAGVDPSKVTMVAAGNDPDRARMMAIGRISGGVLNGINAAQALSSSPNLHVVSDVGATFRDALLGTAVFARGKVIAEKSAALTAAVEALIEASRDLQSNEATAVAQAIASGLPEAAVKSTYDRLYALPTAYYGVDGGIQQSVIESTVKLLKENADIDAIPSYNKLADESFVQAALKNLGPYTK